jgi:hypothetical protein
MASYDSDFQYLCSESEDAVVEFAAKFLTESEFMGTYEAGYDITFLKDGDELYAGWSDENTVITRSTVKSKTMIEARKITEKQESERKAKAYNDGIKRQEIAKLNELKKKYEGNV